ncbi:DUF6497 family protein [uncultured Roseovarius sp.]|uniref:DUF6497 family protein n=1 Tax=uncultured Roseovarius sp. TaxID=293344 RepID=UPI00262865AF|nr:DUF6497 family protein [uncultured Roseovarius sp.]
MMRRVGRAVALSAGLALAQGAAAQEEALPLPSGLVARIQEVLTDRPGVGLTYRFRFVADGFEGVSEEEAELETVLADLIWLCESYALPRLANTGPTPAQVVISLADRPSEFGVFDPTVIQVFEAYRPQDGACIWEMF